MSEPPIHRRRFLRATAAGAAVALSADAYAKVPGSNSRLGVAFLGCGGRAQAHMHLVQRLAPELNLAPAGVCDVWDGADEEYTATFGGTATTRRYRQGLYPAAAQCGLDPADKTRVTKDYRRLLDRPDVDLVCIATPDHWHARQTLDALAAGKDVYVERPMTRTPAEAVAVSDAAAKANRVVAVGVQQLADPSWKASRDLIQTGRLGHVALLSGGAFRNDARGYWRFLRLSDRMTPKTVDWDLFLGHRFDVNGVRLGPPAEAVPFGREAFAQWRCLSAFSAGPFTDLLTAPAARLLAAGGLRFPARVAAAGGLFQEHDGRDIPDVATLAADFPDGYQLQLTATTLSGYPVEEVIRGRRGTLRFVRGGLELYADDPAKASAFPPRLDRPLTPTEVIPAEPPANETEALWRDFLDCVRRRDRATLCPPDLGSAAVAVTAMGWEACRLGMSLGWDRDRRQVRPATTGLQRFGRETAIE